jgi:hypothetical protein
MRDFLERPTASGAKSADARAWCLIALFAETSEMNL